MRGRPPSPKVKLRLVGTYREDRHGNSPDPPATRAECPEWLNENAKKYWEKISAMLSAMRLNSSHYTIPTALLCDALSDWIQYSELAAKLPPALKTETGAFYQNPIVGAKNKAWSRVLLACREFGMSPAALRGIQMPEGSAIDELDEVLA